MSLQDFAQLFAAAGGFAVAMSAVMLFALLLSGRPGDAFALSWRSSLNKALLKDLKDPAIVLGGPLGLMIRLFKIGVALAIIGGVLWLVDKAL